MLLAIFDDLSSFTVFAAGHGGPENREKRHECSADTATVSAADGHPETRRSIGHGGPACARPGSCEQAALVAGRVGRVGPSGGVEVADEFKLFKFASKTENSESNCSTIFCC